MVDMVARRLRRKLGETRAVLANTERLPEVLTPSLEALMKYQAAQSYSSQDEVAESRRLLWEAVTLDTAFAMAWQRLSDAYLSSPLDRDSSGIAAEQVQRHRHRLTEARWADLQLHLRIIEDIAFWDVALEDAERAIRTDPTWSQYYALRLGHEAGMPDSAWTIYLDLERERARRHLRFRPQERYLSSCHSNYLKWSISLGRTQEWISLLDSLGGGIPEDCALDLAFGEALADSEWALADSLLDENAGKWRWPSGIEWTSHQLLAVRGRIAAARERVAPSEEDPFGVSQTQRTRLAHLFLSLVFDLPPTPIPQRVEPMVLESRGKFPVVDFLLYGVREGLVGDTTEGKRVSERLRALRDTATSQTFERNFGPWFVLLEAAPAYRRGEWERATARLEPMVAGIRDPGVGGYLPGAAFVSWWMLAGAYEGLQQPDSAIRYLEAFLPRPVERLDDYTFHGFFRPSARLRLGRLYAEAGDVGGAEEHLQAFLGTFNDPDPDYQWMVEEARRILARLRISSR
jgi:tetratricopeptide (TPR) repeat protein